MSSLSRKEELEIKKAKLAALRKERLDQRDVKKRNEHMPNASAAPTIRAVDTEKILDDLGIEIEKKVKLKKQVSDKSKSHGSSAIDSKFVLFLTE